MNNVSKIPAAAIAVLSLCIASGTAVADPIYLDLVQADWQFQIQTGSVTAGAHFQNGTDCGFPVTTVQTPFLDPVDSCLGTFSQTIPTIPGQQYAFSYDFTVNVGTAGSPGFFAAVFDGIAYLPSDALIQVGPSQFAPAPSTFLQNPPAGCATDSIFCGPLRFGVIGGPSLQTEHELLLATATSNFTTIEFAGSCLSCAFGVDRVHVNVPEPPTWSLFAIAGAVLIGWRLCWDRRRPASKSH